MNKKVVEKAAEVLKALAHPTRLRIVELLQDGEMCVSELVDALGVKQNERQKHLRLLPSRLHGVLLFKR